MELLVVIVRLITYLRTSLRRNESIVTPMQSRRPPSRVQYVEYTYNHPN
jgi:hypothetical protein